MAGLLNGTENETLNTDNPIVKCWHEMKYRPICICFDLDYTLWPMLVDKDILPPLKKKNNIVYDHNNKKVIHFDEVPKVLASLKECFNQSKTKHYLAIASKATTHNLAVELIQMYGWLDYFNSIQVYSGIKIKHMKQIQQELKLKDFRDILFFDDSKSNITQTEALGLTAYQVGHQNGLCVRDFINGLKKFDIQNTILRKN